MKKRLPMKVAVATLSAAMIMSGVPFSAFSNDVGKQIATETVFAAEDIEQEKCPTPVIREPEVTYEGIWSYSNIYVTKVPGYTYYYTLDGSNPTTSSSVLSTAFIRSNIMKTKSVIDDAGFITVKVIAVKEGLTNSDITELKLFVGTEDTVTIIEKKLKEAILSSLGKEVNEENISTPLSQNDMEQITELEVHDAEFTKNSSLSGLEYATNLKILDLSGCKLNNGMLDNVAKNMTEFWPRIETISLSNCGLTGYSSLFYIKMWKSKTLKDLDLSDNMFYGVFSSVKNSGDPIPVLKSLKKINLSGNNLCGFNFTADIPVIEEIDLSGNRIYVDEQSGDWVNKMVSIGLNKFNIDEQKSLSELYAAGIYGNDWSETMINNSNRVIDLGTISTETVSFKLKSWQTDSVCNVYLKELDQTWPVMGYNGDNSAMTAIRIASDEWTIRLNLQPGQNEYTVVVKHFSGEETEYTLKINTTWDRITIPDHQDGSAGIKDPQLQRYVCDILNQSKYRDNPVSPNNYDVTQEDMLEVSTLRGDYDRTQGIYHAIEIHDFSGMEYASNCTDIKIKAAFEGTIDVSAMTKLKTLDVTGSFTSVRGLENLSALTTLVLNGNLTELIGVSADNLPSLTSMTVRGPLASTKSIEIPAKVTALTIDLGDDGSLPNMTKCNSGLKSLTIYGCDRQINTDDIQFTMLSAIILQEVSGDFEIPSNILSAKKLSWTINASSNVSYRVDISKAQIESLAVVGGTGVISGSNDGLNTINVNSNVTFSDDFKAENLTRLSYDVNNAEAALIYEAKLPEAVQIPKVENLSFYSIKLEGGNWPVQINSMSQLKSISFRNTDIDNLSGLDLSKLNQLTSLNFQFNSNLKGEITAEQLPESLQSINIYANLIQIIDGDWSKMKSLSSVTLDSAGLDSFPAKFVRSVPSLTFLNIYRNHYRDIPANAFENSKNLKTVWIGSYLLYKEIDDDWVLDPESGAAKAIAALKELCPDVKIVIEHGTPANDGFEGTYSGLLSLNVKDGTLSGDPWSSRELSLSIAEDCESVTLIPTTYLEDTVVTVNGKDYKSGDEIKVDTGDRSGNITVTCTNSYNDELRLNTVEKYTIAYSKGGYLDNFELEDGKIYQIGSALQQITGAWSMSDQYFDHQAEVRYKDGIFDIRIKCNQPGWIPDVTYNYRGETKHVDIVAQDDQSVTYRFYTDSIDERTALTLNVVPMGNVWKTAYLWLDLTKVRDITDNIGVDKAELNAAIANATGITQKVNESRNIYTADSYAAMEEALSAASAANELSTPSQSRIDAAAKALNDAIDALEIDESKLADKTTLEEALTTAKTLTKGKHTDTNWEALQEAIADAQEVYDDIYATTKEANAAAKALNNAIKAFNSSGESSTMDPASLEDGVYTVYVDMINATDTAQKSMSDGAITKPVTITVKDGEYTMTANFHGIYVTLGGQSLFGYLKELSYWDGEKYAPVTVDTTYDVVDDFNDADEDKVADYKYPHQMTFPLVNKNKGDDENGYVHVQVFVPIMEALSAGSGTQQALMKIDWTSLAEGDEAANEAIRTEKARNELAQTIAEANEIGAKGYTAESYQALTDAVRAGEALMKDTEAKKADYTAANERIKAAMEALEASVVSKDALQSAVDTANEKLAEAEKDTDLYTIDSVKALQTAAANAAAVLKNADATQEEVDQAAAELTKAIEGLTEKVTDRTPLENAIAEAKKISADTYTPNSYQALTDEITAAEAILKQDKVTDDEIAAAVKALEAKTAGLISRADFTELQKAYDEAAAIENQKQPGWDDLQTALANAKNVLDDANATQAQVTDQMNAIKNAVANLGAGIDKSVLANMIEEAKVLDTSKYSDESVKAFRAAIAAAEKVNADEDATQQDIEKQIQMLDNAAKALIQKEEQDVVYDGTYTIDGWLYHASADQYSMGNAALAKPLQVVVKDGKATLRMEFQPLTTSLGKTQFTGYLALLNYFPEWEGGETGFSAPTGETPVATTVEKYYEKTYDSYNDPENGTDKNIKGQLYPHILSMPVDLGDTEVWVQVYVPVMESISAGSGLQYAKLQLDWNTLEQVSGTETDKSALNTALEQAKALADSLKEGDPGYTEENLNALQTAIANGQKVADSFNVDQTAVDAAAQALQSAMDLFNEAPVQADKTELAKAIEVADTYLNDKTSGFSEASLATLQTARDNAAKVNDDPEATQTQVNAAVTAIDNAIRSLTIDKADKSALKDALDAAADILNSSDDYTPAERNVLQNAYDAAQAVYEDDKASQEDVDAQAKILRSLAKSISPAVPAAVEKAGLHDVLITAANMLGRDSTYTFATRHALKKAIRAAEKVFDDPDATQEEVNAAANDVVDAMLDLEVKEGFFNRSDDSKTDENKTDDSQTDDGKTDDGKTDDGKTDDGKTDDGKTDDGKTDDGKTDDGKADADSAVLDNKDLADGVYVVNGNMVKVNKTDASMSDKAINHNIKLTVKDGKYYVTMDFNGLTVGNQLGYLGSLKYFTTGYTTNGYGAPQGTTADAAVDSYQTDADGARIADSFGTDYPDQVTYELIPEALEDGYVPLQVFVPIMEAISTGSGTQPVYLALDWSTIQKTTADDEAFQSQDPADADATPAVDLTDEATGIHVTAAAGVLPEGVKLVVVPITEGTDYDTAKANTFIAGNNFNLYDIHFEDAEGNEVEPNGRVTVSVPIPEDWDSTRLTVYHFNDNGSVTPIIGSVKDGMYTFSTTSFSDYALVERKTGTLTPNTNLNSGADNGSTGSGLTGNTLVAGTDGTDGTKGSSLSGGTSSLSGSGSSLGSSGGSGTTSLSGVKTGDESNVGGWLAMMLIAAGALAVLFAERRRVSAR